MADYVVIVTNELELQTPGIKSLPGQVLAV